MRLDLITIFIEFSTWAVLMASLKIIGSGLLTAIPPRPGTAMSMSISMGCYLSVIENHWSGSANSPPPLLVLELPVFSMEYLSIFTYC